jgi:hypothetical protein
MVEHADELKVSLTIMLVGLLLPNARYVAA